MATDPKAGRDSKLLSGLGRSKRRIAQQRSVADAPAVVTPGDDDDEGVSDWERLFADQPAAGKVDDKAPAPKEAEADGLGAEAVAADSEVVAERPAVAARRRSLLRPVAAALLVVLLAASTSVALLQWRRADRLAHVESVRRTIALTAGTFSQALLSYDYTNLTAARSRVLGMATDSFAQNYTTAFTNGLGSAITQLQAKSTATVRKVFVTDVTGNNADAVVIVDSEVHSTAGTRQVVGSYLDLSFVRQGGRWKVNQVTSIAASSNNLTPNGTTPSTPSAGSTPPSTPGTSVAPSPGG